VRTRIADRAAGWFKPHCPRRTAQWRGRQRNVFLRYL